MNNEEKANEIAKHRESEFGEIRDINGCCYMSALDMAQWKDEQTKQVQEKEIRICNEYIEKHPDNKLMLKYHLGRLSLCDELLGTDSRDKINMAFATMD